MIREASKFDLDACVEMMRQYAQESTIKMLANPDNHIDVHVRNVFTSLIYGRGFVLIDEQARGFLAAIVTPNFWCPVVKEVKELAWWVHPDHRNGTIGGRLFVAYNKKAQELIDQGRADLMTVSLMSNSPAIDLEARGFSRIEASFCKE